MEANGCRTTGPQFLPYRGEDIHFFSQENVRGSGGEQRGEQASVDLLLGSAQETRTTVGRSQTMLLCVPALGGSLWRPELCPERLRTDPQRASVDADCETQNCCSHLSVPTFRDAVPERADESMNPRTEPCERPDCEDF